jgi:hypothetical protein
VNTDLAELSLHYFQSLCHGQEGLTGTHPQSDYGELVDAFMPIYQEMRIRPSMGFGLISAAKAGADQSFASQTEG